MFWKMFPEVNPVNPVILSKKWFLECAFVFLICGITACWVVELLSYGYKISSGYPSLSKGGSWSFLILW
jgi:hypothetical protein